MAENTLSVKIKQRYDTEANWASSNPVLLAGEIAISSDKNGQYKPGDGTSTWSALSYNKADPTTHTHTKSQITDFPSSLKNPNALTIQGNGTTLTNGTYDGSAAKTVNITPSSIGASPTAGSTSLSKLAATVTLGDGESGTILQNSATYQQKFEIIDNSTSGDAVFKFSQSTNSGSNFNNLLEIRDDGNIVANKFSGSLNGNASTATKLATARTIRTNLSSTSTASFDGSANITPGVTGTLPVANGGTGQTTANAAANSFINELSTGSSTPQDADYYVSQYVGGGTTTTTYHRRPMSALWEYIKSKISSVLGLTSSSYGGNSATATALTTSAGSATQPVYFSNGKPVNTTYTLEKSVPSNAVFTDTHYTSGLKVGTSSTATANAAATNGNVYLNALDNSTVRDSHKIVGSGATTVTSDANGVITISSTDNNTTYTAGTGLTLSGTQFKHSNSVTAGTAQGDANKTLTFGGTFTVPTVSYDATGHVTGKGTTTMTMPASTATTSANGLMSSSDKSKLDKLPSPTTSDNDKILSVANGTWSLITVTNAEGVKY